MAKNQEVERIAKKLDKMVHKKNTDGALDLLRELKNIKMSLETLQSTRVGMSVNAVRKQSSDEEVQNLAKTLIKSWKKLLGVKKSGETPTTPTSPTSPAPPTQMTTGPLEWTVSTLQHRLKNISFHMINTIFQEFKSTDMKYKSRLRSRISNLKDQKNPDLRRNVLCGNISPERIASMTAEEMASAELKQIREALTKESIREHQLSKVGGTETDMFICNKCHGKNCTYTQVQTRSADEPMTTFVLCNSCGNRWKFF
ncbi:hypothetical protein INR49_023164 [Caranx melampygus]|nr:hypothetical protein INR49_023164 [Caranx melampygus]